MSEEAMSAEIKATMLDTRDIGLAVRDGLEHITHIGHFVGEQHAGSAEIFDVDVSDPNNVVLELGNGQSFIIRIIAGHLRRQP